MSHDTSVTRALTRSPPTPVRCARWFHRLQTELFAGAVFFVLFFFSPQTHAASTLLCCCFQLQPRCSRPSHHPEAWPRREERAGWPRAAPRVMFCVGWWIKGGDGWQPTNKLKSHAWTCWCYSEKNATTKEKIYWKKLICCKCVSTTCRGNAHTLSE